MPVEMLRVLVLPKIGQHSYGSVFGQDLSGDQPHDGEKARQERLGGGIEQRRDVYLRNHDDVSVLEEGACVVERECVFVFVDDVNGAAAVQNLLAVEVAHDPQSAPRGAATGPSEPSSGLRALGWRETMSLGARTSLCCSSRFRARC
jgi:hypothetical protein